MMTSFTDLYYRLALLFFFLICGFILSRKLDISKETIGQLLIYLITPLVVFSSVAKTALQWHWLLLPLLFFLFCSAIALLTRWVHFALFRHREQSALTAYLCGSANNGYFGFPVALALLGEQYSGMIILAGFGFIFFENTLGFYLAARGQFTVRESLHKVLKLPSLYAFILALIINQAGLGTHSSIALLFDQVRPTYSVLGFLLLGVGLGQVRLRHFPKLIAEQRSFIAFCFAVRFLLWPLVGIAFLWTDRHWLSWLDAPSRQLFFLFCLVPLPANGVALASIFRFPLAPVALTILLSTITSALIVLLGAGYLRHFI